MNRQRSWKEFTLSRSSAERALTSLDLSAYPVVKRDNTLYVTVGKQQDSCVRYAGMD